MLMRLEILVRLQKSSFCRLHAREPRDLDKLNLPNNFCVWRKRFFARKRANNQTVFAGNIHDKKFALGESIHRTVYKHNQIDRFFQDFWEWHLQRKVFRDDYNRIHTN